MANVSEDFERFLYANYPDDYRRATAKDVPEDVLTAIISKHRAHYEVWQAVPEWIKNEYGDRLPKEVLNGNENVRKFVKDEIEKDVKETEACIDVVAVSLSIAALGYAAETAEILAQNQALRQQLLAEAKDGKLNLKQMEQWLALREDDRVAILQDYKNYQPEKYLLHLAKELSRERKRAERGGSDADRAAAEMKAVSLEREFKQYAKKLTGKDVLEKTVNYLRDEPQQAALRHLSPDVLAMFTGVMAGQNIKIEPTLGRGRGSRETIRDAVILSMKQNFANKTRAEKAVSERTRRESKMAERFMIKKTAGNTKGKAGKNLIALRRKEKKQQLQYA
ncbi:MAG: hypothetical protein J6C85_00045 [Alphaproteobacteria bacterium]|nr:hypothetical protein [Alphaproteobacteria bacterium]